MAGSTTAPSEDGLARLEEGAALLRKVPPSKFNILAWELLRTGARFNPDDIGSCGFAGCAFGWFVHAGLFEGLKWTPGSSRRPTYRGVSEYGAAELLFDISHEAANYLFSPAAYEAEMGGMAADLLRKLPPSVVAERIEEFVAHVRKEGAEPPAVQAMFTQ